MGLFCFPSRAPYSHLPKCLPGRLERQQMRAPGALCFPGRSSAAILPCTTGPGQLTHLQTWRMCQHILQTKPSFLWSEHFEEFFSDQWVSQCSKSRSPVFRAITCLLVSTALVTWLWAFCFTKSIAKSLARITWGIIFVCWRTGFQRGKGTRHSI